jgi:hypothetical protein
MATERSNREEQSGKERQGQEPTRKADKGGQHREEEKTRREHGDKGEKGTQKAGAGQQPRKP